MLADIRRQLTSAKYRSDVENVSVEESTSSDVHSRDVTLNWTVAVSCQSGSAMADHDVIVHRPLTLFLLVFPLMTVFGNVLVCLSVLREQTLRTLTNYFIVSLAIADIMVAILVMPFGVYVEFNSSHWLLGNTLCDTWVAFDVMCCTASILNLTAISIDRFIAVTYPISYARHKNSKRLCLTIALTWIASIAISSPIVLGINYSERRASQPTLCTFYNAEFLIFSSMGSFYIPCIAMLILYWRIFYVIRKRGRRPHSLLASCRQRTDFPCRVSAKGASTSSSSFERNATTVTTTTMTRSICRSSDFDDNYRAAAIQSGISLAMIEEEALLPKDPVAFTIVRHDDEEEEEDDDEVDEEEEQRRSAAAEAGPTSRDGLESVAIADLKAPIAAVASRSDRNGVSSPISPTATSLVLLVGPVTRLDDPLASAKGQDGPDIYETTLSGEKTPLDSVDPIGTLTTRTLRVPKVASTSVRVSLKWKMALGRMRRERNSREKKAAKTLAIVIVVFLLCWVPFFTVSIISAICIRYDLFEDYQSVCEIDPVVFAIFVWLGYINSFLNPIIYTIFNVEFRRAFSKILHHPCSSR